MKALIHLDQNGKKVMERRVHDAVMKERADISTRAQYVWAQLHDGRKELCVWASEIEEFPIAVTKKWFPEA